MTLNGDPARHADLLATLQFSDSFFPAGGIAFSWGLETLRADGLVAGATQVLAVVRAHLRLRWASGERPVMRAAFEAMGQGFDALVEVDRTCEAMSLAREWRESSRRLGGAQLGVHSALGNPAAVEYLARQRAGRAPAHLPVVQALVAFANGLPLESAEASAAYAVSVSVVGAALRMGICGHLDAQRILLAVRPELAALLAQPAPALADAWTGGPMLELAVMRHETGQARLFAN